MVFSTLNTLNSSGFVSLLFFIYFIFLIFFSVILLCFAIWISVADSFLIKCILCNILSTLCKCRGLDLINTFNFIGLPLVFGGSWRLDQWYPSVFKSNVTFSAQPTLQHQDRFDYPCNWIITFLTWFWPCIWINSWICSHQLEKAISDVQEAVWPISWWREWIYPI